MSYPRYLAVFEHPLDDLPSEIVRVGSDRQFSAFVDEYMREGRSLTFIEIKADGRVSGSLYGNH